jgi:subtilisin family serine protease
MTWTPPSPDDERLFPFPGGAGRGVRIAVIDSGVHVSNPHIRGVAGGATVRGEGSIEEGLFIDRLGHGTAVMAAIQERAPDAEYLAVKVFDGALRSTAAALFRAIEWAIEQRVHLINLSLGTTNQAHEEEFTRLIAMGLRKGTAVISASEAGGQRCYPGCLGGVFPVKDDERCERTEYRIDSAGVFVASGYPRPVPGVTKERNLNGISFAVANFTGFAARALESLADRSPEALRQALVSQYKSSPP